MGWRGVAADITDKQVAHLRLSWLAKHGCSRLQGYLISRSLPAHAVTHFITHWQGLDTTIPLQAARQVPLHTR